MKSRALVWGLMAENLDVLKCGGWGGIYSPNHQNDRWWRLLSYGAPDSPVRQPRHQAVGFRPLELLTTGPPDSLVVHRTGPVHCPLRLLAPALTSARVGALFTVHCSVADDRWRRRPLLRLAHWTVRWIIAERPPRIPDGGKFGVELPGAPDTVQWHTGQSGAPDQGCLWVVFCSFYLNPFLDFLLVCVEPLAPVELII
jgi:hypothetical protein